MAAWGFKAGADTPDDGFNLDAIYFTDYDYADHLREARRMGALVVWLEDVPLPAITVSAATLGKPPQANVSGGTWRPRA